MLHLYDNNASTTGSGHELDKSQNEVDLIMCSLMLSAKVKHS